MKEIEKIYIEYMSLVYRYLYSVCKDPLLAEEVAQETFFRIVSRCCATSQFIPERFFRKREPVSTQIFHLAMQLLRKELCRKEKELPAEFMLSYAEDIPTMDYLPEVSALYQVELQETREKVMQLPEPVRKAMVLRYYQKMSYKEIAVCLQLNENQIKYLLHIGKLQVEEML